MSDVVLGFALSLFAGFFFGIYMAPRKYSQLDTASFMWIMGISIAVVSIIARLIAKEPPPFHPEDIGLSMLCGVLWFVGSLGFAESIRLIGLTRSTPIKNLGPVIVTFAGVFIFHEFMLNEPIPLIAVIAGSILMTLSATVIGNLGAGDKPDNALAYSETIHKDARKGYYIKGVMWSLVAALGFSIYSIPMKMLFRKMMSDPYWGYKIAPMAWLSGMGLTIGLCAVFYYIIINKTTLLPKISDWKEWFRASSAGLWWTLAIIFTAIAMTKVSMSVVSPLTNLSTLYGVALGAWVFKEVHLEKHWKQVVLGMIATVAGIALLTFAMQFGRI